MKRWYARMADVQGIGFAGSPGVNRDHLPGTRIRPREEYGSLLWPTASGTTSASPAHNRAFGDMRTPDTDTLIRWVWEGLELPGSASDYHFLLQNAVEQFWSRRRTAPAGLHFVEVFAHLDLLLIEAVPQTVLINEKKPSLGFVRISSIATWINLLHAEGALRDALSVSKRIQRFGDNYLDERLEAKVAALDEESA
ncbi:hypothetical protein [Microbispora sp. H11081]|uniref:hypothetical protein n=1 Tax=Microbispora sp. H11081 TaxID=2729107 RepID=UPI001475E303|nr:hypothetical protein [Microbispora sp. H11081]